MSAEHIAEKATLPIETSATGRVAKNASIYLMSQIVSWLVTFISVSYIPRRIGETGSGEAFLAGNAILTALTFLQLGVDPYLSKEVGRDRQQAERLLGATLGLRFTLAPALLLSSLLTLALLQPSEAIWRLGLVGMIGIPFYFLGMACRATLVGREEARKVAMLDILVASAPLFAIPFLRYGPIALLWANSGIQIVFLGLAWTMARGGTIVRPIWNVALWRAIVRGSLPFLLNNFLLQFYTFVSAGLIHRFAGEASAGVYSQANRLFGTFLFIPTAIGMAMLPSLTRLADASPEEFRQTQTRTFCLLVILGLPVMLSVMILARPLSLLLYGSTKFVAMPQVLPIYALALLPMYVVSIMYQFLVAQGRNALWTYFLLTSVGIYALLCSLFIPWTLATYQNGALGAVMATVCTETLSAISAFVLLRTNPFTSETVGRIFRAGLAACGMGAVLWGFVQGLKALEEETAQRTLFLLPYLAVSALTGVAVFVGLAWALRVLAPEEQEKIVGVVRRKLRAG